MNQNNKYSSVSEHMHTHIYIKHKHKNNIVPLDLSGTHGGGRLQTTDEYKINCLHGVILDTINKRHKYVRTEH